MTSLSTTRMRFLLDLSCEKQEQSNCVPRTPVRCYRAHAKMTHATS